jgi:hypothetical protein
VQLSTTRRAWHRWQACAGVWQGWTICPTLLAPEVEEVIPRVVRRPAARTLAATVADGLESGGVLVLLDLEPILGVHVAALLNQWHVANGVLVLPRWPYRQAILPGRRSGHALVGQTRRLTSRTPAERRVRPRRGTQPAGAAALRPVTPRADNRYRLRSCRSARSGRPRARGIRQVRKLSAA